jgi:hypothetical protein
VAYQKDIHLRIAVSATNLSAVQPQVPEAKVSFDAVIDCIDLARELGILSQKGSSI